MSTDHAVYTSFSCKDAGGDSWITQLSVGRRQSFRRSRDAELVSIAKFFIPA